MGLFFVTMFPLTFVSNSFVDPDRLPGVLATIANWNPISAVAAAARELLGNTGAAAPAGVWPLQHPVLAAVLWCLAIIAVFAPLSVALYRRATSR